MPGTSVVLGPSGEGPSLPGDKDGARAVSLPRAEGCAGVVDAGRRTDENPAGGAVSSTCFTPTHESSGSLVL